ncbi:gamma-butyrobetaine hydroxylase-like domain-containing protein [Paraburkholderia kururiensis]|uniref:DUF971 domain-containing protein n=1 Tax=Paraburkholderia kururiensis TaxID=984307 RepID=A0ABZ0WL41_9BURK|nr:DUF971 domain-containing protein [Paraburkholderia kururiensis]WQD78073.1 DUF971 domain-containing protein [Paraburkholderia kururiensis]
MKLPEEVTLNRAARTLTLRWSGTQTATLHCAALRAACPCAACRHARLTAGTVHVPQDVTLLDVQPVGHYGVQLAFSDGHARGIYPWPYLAQLGA